MLSRSRSSQRGAVSSGNASTTCCAVQVGGMLGRIDVDHASAFVREDDQHEQDAPVSVETVKKSIDTIDVK
jgi:hypothetical protein